MPRDFEEGTIVGFESGDSDDVGEEASLKTAYLSVISRDDCEFASEFSFCAANKFYDANVCKTDVGASFNVHYRGRVMLAGLLTAIPSLCAKGDRSHYLRVQEFVPWIRAVTNS